MPTGPFAKGAAAAALLLIFGWALLKGVQRRRLNDELEGLRERLVELRTEASDCQSELIDEEADLHQYSAKLDSTHLALLAYQTERNGGVPQARYDEYLGKLEAYKVGVSDWQIRSDSLHAHLEGCQLVARRHNQLSDSIQARIDSVLNRRR